MNCLVRKIIRVCNRQQSLSNLTIIFILRVPNPFKFNTLTAGSYMAHCRTSLGSESECFMALGLHINYILSLICNAFQRAIFCRCWPSMISKNKFHLFLGLSFFLDINPIPDPIFLDIRLSEVEFCWVLSS